MSSRFVDVPEDLAPHMDAVVAEIRAAFEDADMPLGKKDIAYGNPQGNKRDAMGAFELAQTATLFVSAIVVTKLTEEFVEKVLLPRLKDNFKDAKEAIESLVARMRSDG